MTITQLSRPGRWAVVGSYPAVMAAGFFLFATFEGVGLPVSLASFSAVFACVILIVMHEILWPNRAEWRPSWQEVRADVMFLLAVQIALPYALSVTLVVWIVGALRAHELAVSTIWPHQWPDIAQAALMLLSADFLRYWLHRAFHTFAPMWRFHAVHHSPHQLYSLNVGRFHPLEKAVQYAFDALPFALLGVSDQVLALYFVFYGVNGFFQHSNCRIRLGPLNYLVSGPELHRWHHSEITHESNSNFGNNLIIWDILFRTRFLPRDRKVGSLGLHNRAYPMGFLQQMRTPFVRELDRG